ncbi:hypothetical protein ScPMuIL_000386 [Solemya velum]
MEVAVGSYEELILGFHVIATEKEVEFKQSFTDHSHTGCVRSVAISRRSVLASGGTDETIRLLRVLFVGSVTWLDFFRGTHMVSCSEDGTLCVWKCFTWECIKTFKGHKGAVNCASIHPSGKLMLSVGADRSLRMWNLVTGRSAYITNIKKVAEIVKWSPNGELYAIVSNTTIDVYNTQTELQLSITSTRKINSIAMFSVSILVYGGEGGDLFIHNLKTNKELHTWSTDTNRIKGLAISTSVLDGETTWLTTASSDGFLKIYELKIQQDAVVTKLVANHNTGFRLTCLAITPQTTANKKSRKTDQPITEKNAEGSDAESAESAESDSEDESDLEQPKIKIEKMMKTDEKREKRIKPVKTKHNVRKPKDRARKGKMKKLKSLG